MSMAGDHRSLPVPEALEGERVDAAMARLFGLSRTRAAQQLERFLAGYDLPVLTYLRDTQLYVQAAAHGMTLFDLPPSRVQKDLVQWRPVIDWIGG